MKEFMEFMNSREVDPPQTLTESTLKVIHQKLNPSIPSVAAKILGLHAILSIVTLSLCSQFGVRLFSFMDLMDSFMSVVGHQYCMALCGAFYIGASALALTFLLSPEEVLAVRRNRVLQFLIVAGVSLAAFIFFGGEILLVPALIWLIGAFSAWIATVELGWGIRTWAMRSSV